MKTSLVFINRWVIRTLILTATLVLAACFHDDDGDTNIEQPSPNLNWDQGNWDQKNWQ